MIIVKDFKDIEKLNFGDQYIIEPDGIDYQDLGKVAKFQEKINEIQSKIESKIRNGNLVNSDKIQSKKNQLEIFKLMLSKGSTFPDFNKEFNEPELIEIGNELGLGFTTKGTKKEKIELIIEKLSK